MKANIIKTNGVTLPINPKNGTDFSLKELKKIVGGIIEVIQLTKKRVMVVSGEGMVKGLPYNHLASLCIKEAGLDGFIVGNVLVCDSEMVK